MNIFRAKFKFRYILIRHPVSKKTQLEQPERLRSEDTPRRPMITHTIDQFIFRILL